MNRHTQTARPFFNKSTGRRRALRQGLRGVESLEPRTLMAVSIGDYVWNDLNFDGIQNESPSDGVNGVVVSLYTSAGTLVGSPTQTANNTNGDPGYYSFNDIAPGDYYVLIARPTGQAFTLPIQGVDPNIDSNVNKNGRSDTFTLGASVPNLSIDAGLVPTASVGTFVWWDLNSDGLQIDTEGGIGGATVRLLQSGSQVDSQTTDEFGQYFFRDLTPGKYQVQFDRPVGFEVPSPADVPSPVAGRNDKDDSDGLGPMLITAEFTLAPGEVNRDVDQGFNKSGKVGDYVWRDANNNGVQDEAASLGMNGVSVSLFTAANVLAAGPVLTANDSFGNPGYYLFTGLIPGQYYVKFTAPAGQVFTASLVGNTLTDSNANASGQTGVFSIGAGVEELSIDAGLRPVDLSLTSFVTDTTPPLNATLTYSITVSNSSGFSAASGVTVSDVLPAGLTYVSDNAGGKYNSATRTWNVGNLAPGESVLLQVVAAVTSGGTKTNFVQVQTADQPDVDSVPGNAPGVHQDDDVTVSITASANIGNYVWRDVNNDGIQNEATIYGINGVTVTLYTSSGTQVGLPTTTSDDLVGKPGYYFFADINPGDYYVVVSPPAGQVFTTSFVGLPGADSNVDSTGKSNVFTLVSGVDDPSIDAGIRPIDLSLSNTVSSAAPRVGTNVTYTLTVANASTFSTASSVTVQDILPAGVTYVSSSGVGSYNSGTGIWTIGSIAGGANATLQVVATVTNGGTKSNLAQIQTASLPDLDSTPGNAPGVTEDDDATSVFTPPASIGNYVWRDVNNDGIQNEAATYGVNGVTVTLFTSSNTQVGLPTTTISNGGNPGYYAFNDIAPGNYYIVVTPPAGQVFTSPFAALPGTPTTDSNVDSNGKSNVFALLSGTDNLSIDAGLRPIDLSLTKTVNDTTPRVGTTVTYTTTVTNSGGLSTATLVTVQDTLPAGLTFVSSSGTGTYDSATGVWSIPSIASGTSVALQVLATVAVGGTKSSTTQVQTAGQPDLDSTPGNAPAVHEDDDVNTSITPSASIGNYVWRDDNGDGIQNEPTSAGLNGVSVTLYTSAGTQVGSPVVTANDTSGNPGYYLFTDIDPGSYYVKVTAPTDLLFTTQFAAAATQATDSNVDTSGKSNTFTLASGVDDTSIDAGLKKSQVCAVLDFNGNTSTSGTMGNIRTFASGSISVNASGFSRDRTTGAWASAYLGSYGGGLGVTDSSEGSGANDTHTVDNLDGRDNYILFEFNQAVVIDTAYLGYVVTDSDMQVWIGTVPNAFTSHQTLSDSLLAGLYTEYNWTELTTTRLADLNANGILGNVIVIAADTSDASPEDRFKLGQMTICTPSNQQPASLGNFVWHDMNGNGIQDSVEPGIQGATVTLTGGGADGIINGIGDTVVSTTTSSTGAYSFTGLVPGTQYRAAFGLPTGYTTASQRKLGTDTSLDSDGLVSDIIILGSGQNNSTIDAGFYKEVKVGNFVWNDLDKDGFQDTTELGIGGVLINLTGTSGSGAAINLSTTTASNGSYLFSSLPPGTYQVSIAASNLTTGPLSGYAASPTLVGTDRSLDSNVSPSATSPATLVSGSTDLNVDFGYYFDTTKVCINLFLEGNTATSGAAGNIITFASGSISAKASAFSRDLAGSWAAAYLGRYGGGLGVTDTSEGNGSGNTHTVDNLGRNNYVLFEFSQAVTVDTAFLGYVVGDSDIKVWIGNASNAFNSHYTLSDSFLSGLGFSEVNLGAGSTRTADINASNLTGNILVISANMLEVSPNDQFKIAELGLCAMIPTAQAATKFFSVDDDANKTFKYNSVGTPTQDFASAPLDPRGITTNVSGSNVWIANTDGRIYNYTSAGVHVANWSSKVSGLQGVTTNGTHIWTVSDATDRVYYYPNGTTYANGSLVSPASSFALNWYNNNPTDLTTDGTYIWVVNEGNIAGGVGDMVFKYTLSGTYLGRWQLDSANARPTGITIDPAGGNKIWIVDNSTDRIYEYSGATGCVSGGIVASKSYALATGNTNPQGIADPPGPGDDAQTTESSLVVNEQYINADINPSFNSFSATDVNSDGITSPIDALLIINRLNALKRDSGTDSEAWIYDDVSNDRRLSPLDALLVINQLNSDRQSAANPLEAPLSETQSSSNNQTDSSSSSSIPSELGAGEGESFAIRDAFFAGYSQSFNADSESESGFNRSGDRSARGLRRVSR